MIRTPGERWTCGCGAQLVGARTRTGAVAPMRVEPSMEGNVWVGRAAVPDDAGEREIRAHTLAGDALASAREAGMALYINHFADCPRRTNYARRNDA